MSEPATTKLLPHLVRSNQETSGLWSLFKGLSPSWEPRRRFVREEFVPLIDFLEFSGAPADTIVSDALQKFDADAITAARTLIEWVCKHRLEDAGGNPTYGASDDLAKLYRQASELLNIRAFAALQRHLQPHLTQRPERR